MSDRSFNLIALAAGVFVAFGSTSQAAAQDDAIDEIVVTGSHIRRPEYGSRAPIQIVDSVKIALIGAERPGDILKELTINSGSALYDESGGGSGVIQFSIRNLGWGSTLTLLNGKRAGVHAGADFTGENFVNINQFPLAMIERIEVLTDGASATYGSQAVAGVANIITRKGFEGFEISGGYSAAETDSWHISLAAGAGFDQGRFNVYATYYEQDHIERSEFDWMRDRLMGQGDISRSRFLSSQGSPGSYRRAVIDPVTGEAMDVPGTRNHPDPECEAAGGVFLNPLDIGGPDNTCRYHFIDQVSIIHAEKRAQIFTEFDWEFTDSIRYYTEASFSHNRTNRDVGGLLLNTGRAAGGGITVLPSHPFNFFIEDPNDPGGLIWIDPANWDPTIHTAATLRMMGRPLGAEVDNTELTLQGRRDLDYLRFLNGVEFQLPGDWYLDASYGWAKNSDVTDRPHNYRSDIFQDLVRDGLWNPFGTRLSNPTLVSPKDGTSTAGNDPTIQALYDARSVASRQSVQQIVDLVASGEAFSVGDNTVSMAIGGQFRDLLIESIPDSLSAAGLSLLPGLLGVSKDSQNVLAFFAEAIMPIGDTTEVQVAVRYEDYGGGVSTTDPKFSFEFRPTDWLGLRGSWGTSFLAPTVHQTATTRGGGFLDDPASPTGPDGTLICNDIGLGNSVSITNRGAPDLKSQESVNFVLGVVIQTERFRGSIDYWNFDYTDLVAPSESAQAIVQNDCDDDGIPNDPRVIRHANGQLREVFTQFENIGAVETDGIDVNADYSLEFGSSTLLFDFAATFVNKFDVDIDGDGTLEFDGAGSRNFRNNFRTLPEIRANLGATWLTGSHSVNLTARFLDSYRNDQSNNAEIDAWTTIDAQYSYVFNGLIGNGDTTVTIGANNLTDVDPPALSRANADGTPMTRFRPNGTYNRGWIDRPGYDGSAGHNLRGRIVYFRFKQSF